MVDEFSWLMFSAAIITLLAFLTAIRFDTEKGVLISPLKVWAALGILTTVPYMISLSFRVLRPDPLLENALWAQDYESLLVEYAVLNAIAVLALVVGYRGSFGETIAQFARRIPTQLPDGKEMHIAFACLALGGVLWTLMLVRAGGIWALLTNIQYRSQILSGVGYLMQFGSGLLTIGALLGFYAAGKKKAKWLLAFWLIVLVLVALSLSITGGRKGTIYLVIGAVVTWHYCVEPIRKLSGALIVVGLLLVAYFVVIMSIRTLGSIEAVMYSPYALLLAMRDSVSWMFANLSYVDTYVYVIAYFKKAGYWFGATFFDLLSVWMPSAVTPDKPPVDDGVYLRSLAEGLSVRPGSAAASMYPSSWPPETFGLGYMSFGVGGVLVFFLILGAIIRTSIEFARVHGFSFLSVFLLCHVLLNFELTNLRLVQLVTTIVTLAGVLVVSYLFRPIRNSSQIGAASVRSSA